VESAGQQTANRARRLGEQREERLDPVARYAAGPLARRLGASARDVTVAPAERGKRSLVYFVSVGAEPRAVLRAVPRLSEAWVLRHNLRLLARHGVPAPALIEARLCPLTRLRWGFWPVAEEWVQGHHLDELDDRGLALRAVARTIACFHNVRRRFWGRPLCPRVTSYRRYLLNRIIERARNFDAVLEEPKADALIAWCRRHAAAAPLGPPYSLTHSRIYTPNFVVTDADEAYAVDLLECRYGTFAMDLTWALKRLCEDRADACEAFLEAYFAERPDGTRQIYDASRPFFETDYHLARASIYARRLPRRLHVPQARRQKLDVLHTHARHLSELTGVSLAIQEPTESAAPNRTGTPQD
jgi:hypothetical protein